MPEHRQQPSATQPIFERPIIRGAVATTARPSPTVTVDQSFSQVDPTSVSPIYFDVVFSEPVTGFTAEDVVISGSAGADIAYVTGSEANYTVAVVMVPPVPVTVTINLAAGNQIPGGPVMFDVVFSEPVFGFTTGDVTLAGTAGATTGTVSGSGAVYTVAVTGMTALTGTVTAKIPAGVAMAVATGVLNLVSSTALGFWCMVAVTGIPVFAHEIHPEAASMWLGRQDDIVCLTSTEANKLSIFDISNRASPTLLSELQSVPTAGGLIDTDGTYLFTATEHWFGVLDPNPPGIPDVVTTIELLHPTTGEYLYPQSMVIAADHVYLIWVTGLPGTLHESGMTIIDISTPTAPVVVSSDFMDLNSTGSTNRIKYQAGYIYARATNNVDGFDVINVSNPAAPVLAATFIDNVNTRDPKSLGVNGNYAYLMGDPDFSGANQYFATIDISTPSTPTYVGSLTSGTLFGPFQGGADMVVDGNRLYAINSGTNHALILVMDISVPSAPTPVTEFNTGPTLDWSTLGFIEGNLLYVMINETFNYGMAVIDITNPAALSFVGSLTNDFGFRFPAGMTKVGGYVYLSLSPGGGSTSVTLGVIDVTPASTPTLVSSWDQTRDAMLSPQAVEIQGDYAYVAATDRLTIVDISDPTNPTVAGMLRESPGLNQTRALAVSGNYAYTVGPTVTNGVDQLVVVNISNPSNPSIVGSTSNATLFDGLSDVVVDGGFVYMTAETSDRLLVVNVSTPSAPTLVGSVTNVNLNGPRRLIKDGGYCYVTVPQISTVMAVDVSTPGSPFVAAGAGASGATGIYKNGNIVGVGRSLSAGLSGIVCFNAANVAIGNFPVVGSTPSSAPDTQTAWDLVAVDDYVYGASRSDGLLVFEMRCS